MKLKKGLIAVLIAANVIMLVVGVSHTTQFGQRRSEISARGGANFARHTIAEGRSAAHAHGERRFPRRRKLTRSLSTEEHPDLKTSLVHGGFMTGVPSDANIIDNICPVDRELESADYLRPQ